MGAADVVVHASTGEPFGIVAIEAMACGRPVITGNDGGVIEAVRNGIEGIHVPYENHEFLAKALIRIFRETDLRLEMGQRGFERAKKFSRQLYATQICQQLEESMATRNSC
jgi:D-inositol-3-phosphate glycosyltransferase